jgi:hypothetical protein
LTILRHDNIVPLLGTATGFGRRPELPSLVTPWIPNGTLNVYLASKHNDLTMLDRSRMVSRIPVASFRLSRLTRSQKLEGVSAGLRYCQFHIYSQDVLVTYHGCSTLGACRARGYNRGEPRVARVFLNTNKTAGEHTD